MKKRILLNELLGERKEKGNFSTILVETRKFDSYTLMTYRVNLLADESVEVNISLPSQEKEQYPAAICNHSHGGNYDLGKKEILESNHYLYKKPFVEDLSELGYVTFSIDSRGFGTRKTMTEAELVKESLLYGRTLWGLMLYDLQYLIDFIEYQQIVNISSIGMLGMSMGALQSWWCAALDDRIEWIVDIGGQVKFETLIEEKALNKHGHYYYVPCLLKYFSTEDIQALIVPKKRLSLVGDQDQNCPQKGIEALNCFLSEQYELAGAKENWQCFISPGKHEETKSMREQWKEFLKRMKMDDNWTT